MNNRNKSNKTESDSEHKRKWVKPEFFEENYRNTRNEPPNIPGAPEQAGS